MVFKVIPFVLNVSVWSHKTKQVADIAAKTVKTMIEKYRYTTGSGSYCC